MHCTGSKPVTDGFGDLDLPESLRDLARRHQEDVADLVSRLRSVGLDAVTIEAAVDQIMASYRVQLVDAMKALGLSHA